MSSEALIDLLQIILLTVTSVVVMVTTAFKRDHGLINSLTQTGLFASLLIFVFVDPILPLQVTPLLIFDEYSMFFSTLIIVGAIAVTALAYPYFEKHNDLNEEFYILVLTGTLGGVVMAGANHFVSFFLGMEMVSISLYAMIAYPIHAKAVAKHPLEAAVKYMILSGLASGMILFGVALIYAMLGTLEFNSLASATAALTGNNNPVLLTGYMLIIAGISFKLSLVPFHIWTPDVYEGAPVPVTAYLSTLSKAGMIAVVLRLVLDARVFDYPQITVVLSLMAAASMIFGNLLALMQNNVKRMFAYSSIAHLGYLLVVVIAAAVVPDMLSIESVCYYIAAYFLMTLGGFAVLSALSNAGKELDTFSDLKGLFWRNPWLGGVMIIVLFSLAGIPLTAGFIGKFYIFNTGVEGGLWFLLTMLIIGSSISLYYYLRLVYTILLPASDSLKNDPASAAVPMGTNAVLGVMTIAIIYLGIYPMPLITRLQSLASIF
jgi:NADH-quinone oxidoreductase subunit N